MTKRVVARLSFLTLGVVCLSLYMDSIPIKELKGYTPYALYLQAKNEQCPFNAQAKNFSPLPNRHFIAHAGGAIIENGKPFTYTNSKEALLQSIAEGFSFIELDLMLDSSGGIFGAHDYEHFSSITGGSLPKDSPPSKEQILSSKIHNHFTPLVAESIAEIFLANPRIYLVTDKLNDFSAITSQLPFIDRILVEVFSLRDYYKAKRLGLLPMLSTSNIALAKSLKIPMVATHTSMLKDPTKLKLAREYITQGGCIMAFSSNEKSFIQTHLEASATMFYTDYFDINANKCKLEEEMCKTY